MKCVPPASGRMEALAWWDVPSICGIPGRQTQRSCQCDPQQPSKLILQLFGLSLTPRREVCFTPNREILTSTKHRSRGGAQVLSLFSLTLVVSSRRARREAMVILH